MKISEKHVDEICQPGTEKCCAYLVCGANGFECAKKDLGTKAVIDRRLKEGAMRAVGDNCEGPKVVN